MSPYAEEAQKLLTQQPECQIPQTGQPAVCAPGCVHEQLNVARAQVYTLMDFTSYLDIIAHNLNEISDQVTDLANH